MNRFAQLILKQRLPIILFVIGVTLVFAYQLKNLEINSDLVSYLNPDDPAVRLYNRIGEEYAGTSLAIVGLEANDVFKFQTLQTINQLTEKIKQVQGVAVVTSLTDILDIRSRQGMLEVGRLINKDNISSDLHELQQIRKYTLSKEMYEGRIVSSDGKIALIIARLQQDADKQKIAKKIQHIAKREASNYQLYFSGLPMQMYEINGMIIEDMIRLVPLISILLLLVLYFSFRLLRGTILPLVTVLISTVWAMGIMIISGIALSIVSNIMPVLLIAIGSAYAIHMMARYLEEVRTIPDSKEASKRALVEVGIPIILTAITTMIGLFSFAGSYLTSVTHFGIFTGIGVLLALFITIAFLPSLLSYTKPPKIKTSETNKETNIVVRWMIVLSRIILRWKKIIVFGAGIVILLAILGLPKLHREVNMIEYFPKDTDIRIAENMMQQNFGGSHQIQILVEGDLKSPVVLHQMRTLEKFLKTLPFVNQPQSVADLICNMNEIVNQHYTVPDTRAGVGNLYFFIEGESIMKQLINADATEGIIQASVSTMETQEILNTVRTINHYLHHKIDTVLIKAEVENIQNTKVRQVQVREVLQRIAFDVHRRFPGIALDTTALKQKISTIQKTERVNFPVDTLNHIRDRLLDFFRTESAIIIEQDQQIQRIVQQTIQRLEQSGTVPAESALVHLIDRSVSQKLSKDREIIHETAHSMKMILNGFFHRQRIAAGVQHILHLFPEKLRTIRAFRDDLRDDLWILNNRYVAISKNKAQQLGIKGKVISYNFRQSGMPLIFTHLDKSILKSQIQSLIIAFVVVTLLLIIQMRSILGGIISVSPIALTVLFNFALMAYLGVPLDIATLMIASIAIGIGIDYTIHFTNRFKKEIERKSNIKEALESTLMTTGRAIFINALSVASGFLILVFAQILPVRHFGWLTATTMVFSASGALIFLPALIIFTQAKFVGKLKSNNKNSES